MNIADWKDLNGQFIKTDNEKETVVRVENPTVEQLKNLIDLSEWDLDLMGYLSLVVVNDYTTDFSWVYLVSDSGTSMELKPSKKHPGRLIAWSDDYSDKWELVEYIEIDCNRETEVNTFLVKVPSENEPIELYMS